jgi:hypothetical protein
MAKIPRRLRQGFILINLHSKVISMLPKAARLVTKYLTPPLETTPPLKATAPKAEAHAAAPGARTLIRIVISIAGFDPERGTMHAWIKSIAGNYLKNCYYKKQEEPDLVFCEQDALDLYENNPSIQEFPDTAGIEEETKEDSPLLQRLRKALEAISQRGQELMFGRCIRLSSGT